MTMARLGTHGEYLKTDLKLSARDEFSNPNRSNRISIYTLDDALRKDVMERLRYEPRLMGYGLRSTPETDLKKMIAAMKDIANDSKSDKIMIMDARRATLTLLRPVFNRVITLNRRDFSKYAFPVLIADGPTDLFKPGKTLDVFTSYLMDLKKDFIQSLFFYDPFLHYQPFEMPHLTMDDDWALADYLPDRLKKELVAKRLVGAQDQVKVKHIRKHYRGIKAGEANEELRRRRMGELKEIYLARLEQAFPGDPRTASWPTKEGYPIEGFGSMHMYPFFFEELVADLVEKKG